MSLRSRCSRETGRIGRLIHSLDHSSNTRAFRFSPRSCETIYKLPHTFGARRHLYIRIPLITACGPPHQQKPPPPTSFILHPLTKQSLPHKTTLPRAALGITVVICALQLATRTGPETNTQKEFRHVGLCGSTCTRSRFQRA
jgi:hypothetical protein